MKRIALLTLTGLFLFVLISVYLVSCSNGSGTPSSDAAFNRTTSNAASAARLLLSAQTSTAEYIFTDLGTLGGNGSNAYGINNKGQVVGQSETTEGENHAFLYSNGSMTDLGTLGGSESAAFDINDNGQVVGWADIPGNMNHAFLYSNGTMTDLGTFGGDYSTARSINNSGQVTGGAWPAIIANHAFLYSNGTMTDLGTLGGRSSAGFGINDLGQVVGWSNPPADDSHSHAFLYSNGSMTDLGIPLGWSCGADSINNNGQIVGSCTLYTGTSPTDISSQHFAYLYSNGSTIDLGTLGGKNSYAYGINDSGQIVGVSDKDIQGWSPRPFLYSNGSMVDLSNIIPAGSGWTVTTASSINNYGQIVGHGLFNYHGRAFLLTPVNFTNIGTNVTVIPKDTTTGTRPVAVTFATVTAPGTTTLTTSEQGPPPPAGFKLGNPPVYYDISTTAGYTPPITVCIDYSGISFGNENSLSLRHYEDTNGDGTPDKWVDRTTVNDTVNKIICAEVSSLSLFAIFEPAWQFTGFFRPIDNLPAVNVVNAGQAIPVKWRVTKADGTPISDTASFSQLVSHEVDCGDLTGDAATSVAESAAGRSGLQYQGDGYWQFNWKTPKSYDDQCRRMVLTLGDGSTHEAVFKFK